MNAIRIGVVGLGAMGRQHVRVIRQLEQYELVAVVDPNPKARELVLREQPNVMEYAEPSDLFCSTVEAVVVASPTWQHGGQTELFVQHGLHVLVEKPFVLGMTDIDRLKQVLMTSEVTVLVGHIERFNPAVIALRAYLDTGGLGDLLSFSARRVGIARPSVPSANVIYDLAIHDIDVIQFITGRAPTVIGARGGLLPGNSLEDFVHLLLGYGPVAAAVEANWITPSKSRRLSVTGSGGFAELDYIRQEVFVHQGRTEQVGDGENLFSYISERGDPTRLQIDREEPLCRELLHFHDCIKGISQPGIAIEEAVKAVECCEVASEFIRVHNDIRGLDLRRG